MQLLECIHSRLRNVSALQTISILAPFYLALLAKFSHASNAESITPEDHNYHRILELRSDVYGSQENRYQLEANRYEPDFIGADRGIIGRADPPMELANNVPGELNIDFGGEPQFWTFPEKEVTSKRLQAPNVRSSLAERDVEESPYTLDNKIEGSLRQQQANPKTLYITFTMCDQPQPTSPNPNGAPAPLQLYVSTHSNNRSPNQDHYDYAVPVVYGFGSLNVSTSGDVYFGVTAPKKSSQFEGSYNYRLTASIDEPYASFVKDSSSMLFIDSDSNSALLSSNHSTNNTKYSIFVQPQDDPTLWGLSSSLCGMEKKARIKGNIGNAPSDDVDTAVMVFAGDKKQQFYVKNLNGSSAYYGVLAVNGNSSSTNAGAGVVGGGGTVWKTVNFTTKASANCAVIYNLTFCSDVAYAVPANPKNQTGLTGLAQLYDNDAKAKYENFSRSIQQVPCDTTSTAQYSLARNCQDCKNDYKTWLCAVTIPRCADFSSNASHLVRRAGSTSYHGSMDNKSAIRIDSSRNPMIDEQIRPGPYKEVLPCANLCHEIVRSCPASLGFACPLQDHGLNDSYGTGPDVPCNYPGAPFRSRAIRLRGDVWVAGGALLVVLTNFV